MTNKKIKYVDGFKVRMMLDLEFAMCHEHSLDYKYYAPKFYIPIDEMWIDHAFKDEEELVVKIETEDVPGETVEERREYRKRLFTEKEPIPEFKIRSELIDGLNVVKIDGGIFRKYIDPDFMQGGHEFVYDYVPAGEVWLDAKNSSDELPFILHHELFERDLMSRGETYDNAHDAALSSEKKMRRAAGACYPGDAKYTHTHISDFYV